MGLGEWEKGRTTRDSGSDDSDTLLAVSQRSQTSTQEPNLAMTTWGLAHWFIYTYKKLTSVILKLRGFT